MVLRSGHSLWQSPEGDKRGMTSGLFGRARIAGVVAVLLVAAGLAGLAGAEAPANDAFQRTWARTDQPVASGAVSRTWMWGPKANTGALQEDYVEAPGGTRTVQYYDKSRMEITDPAGDQTSPWYVTNGLLVNELVTGNMQVGNDAFEQRSAAEVNIAGDPGEHPTYADIDAFGLRGQPATAVGATLMTWVDASGILATSPANPPAAVTAAERVTVPGIDHTVASVFWEFMNSTGTVDENGQTIQASLFLNAYYATGYPITEAYWSVVKIGGTPTTVLWQCFERRCLTYNPANGPGWQVEAGNVGMHYHQWRYDGANPEPNPTEPPVLTPTPSPTPDPGYKTFGDGAWIVGKDIEAGTYRSSGSGNFCYWERLSGFGGTLQEIIANDIASARAIVTIDANDAGFRSEDCGTWSTDLSPITASQTAPFDDGTWIVGVDIAPGTWRNDDSSESCYWERVSDFSGEFDALIANEFSSAIQTVTISATDAGFKSERCGTWTRIGD